MAVITGQPGDVNDTLTDTAGDDQISALGGNDTIRISSGVDTVLGGTGQDLLIYSTTDVFTQGDSIDLGEGNDVVGVQTPTGVTQVRVTFTSAEVGNGSANDSNTMANQNGGLAVRLQLEGAGDSLTGAVTRADDEGITFSTIADTNFSTFDVRDLVSGAARGDQFRTVTLGTSAGDNYVGSASADYINTGGGNDTVSGADGNDFLVGGGGDDTLDGGAGDDSFIAGGGADTVTGGAGVDTIATFNIATDGADRVNLGVETGVLGTTETFDRFNISAGASGQVRLTFTSAEVGNGAANDAGTMTNQDGGLAVRVQLEGAGDALPAGNLVSRADDEGINFIAAAGTTFDVRDLVSGAARGDLFEIVTLGTSGTDVLTAVASARPYYFNAGAGNDTITGGTGADFLVGGGGEDLLTGGAGDDSFIGGAGNDTIAGGAGNDRVASFNITSDGADSVNLGDGLDIALITATGATPAAPQQVRVTFTSAEVGNGNANDSGTMTNQDGGLAVRVQLESANDVLSVLNPITRFDDEGIVLNAPTAGLTFDVRDLVAGTQRGNLFNHVILGTSAADTFVASTPGGVYYFNAGAGNDTVTGGDAADFLVGGGGDDTLNGGAGQDNFLGGAGNDTIDSLDRPANLFAGAIAPERDVVDAGAGDDNVTGGRLDQLIGGDGNDFLLINFDFNGPFTTNPPPPRPAVTLTLDASGTGTAGDGTSITGFERVNFFLTDSADSANTGNVTASLSGAGGNDVLTTGSGDDQVFGGDGADVISTGAGNDTVGGGAGADVIDTGLGDDSISFDPSNDGADIINTGLGGNDTVRFEGFNTSQIRVTFTSAEVGDGSVNDSRTMANQDGGLAVRVQAEDASGALTGAVSRFDDEGITFLEGTQGYTFDVRDLVSGVQRGDRFIGVVLGTSGADTLSFFPPFREAQPFYYNAGGGADTVVGGSGADFLVGGAGDDTLSGGAGNDSFLGGGGADLIRGGDGDDNVNGGAGVDALVGGAGADTFVISAANESNAAGYDTINDFAAGSDRIDISALNATALSLVRQGNGTFLFGQSAGGNFQLGVTSIVNVGDLLIGSSTAQVFLLGESFADVLAGSARNDTIAGGGGSDTIIGGGGADLLAGGDSFDTFRYTALSDSTNTGADILDDFQTGGDVLDLQFLPGLTQVSVVTSGAASFVFGNNGFQINSKATINGTDLLLAANVGVYLQGDAGANTLRGGSRAESINGGAGNDTIIGGLGGDALFGGAGADTFVYGSVVESTASLGYDSIFGFERGVDKIDLRGLGANASRLGYAFVGQDAFLFVDTTGDGRADMQIALFGVNAPLAAGDFLFS